MAEQPTTIDKHIRISRDRAERLSHIARTRRMSDDQLIEKALDLLFTSLDLLGGPDDRLEERPLRAGGRLGAGGSSAAGGETVSAMLFKQRLLDMGLIAEIKLPAPAAPPRSFTPIHVRGKPLSAMIIEERR